MESMKSEERRKLIAQWNDESGDENK